MSDAEPLSAPAALSTRPDEQGEKLSEWLASAGWRPVAAPLMRFQALEAPADPADAWGVALTSASGARAAPAGGALRALPCWCVGEATAEAARAAGFADVRSADGDAAALAALIAASAPAGAVLLHLRGRFGGDGLAEALAARGLGLRQAVVYAMEAAEALPPEAEAALAAGEVRMIPVYSPRSGRILVRLLDGRFDLARVTAVAISRAAAEGLAAAGFGRVKIAKAPTRKAMRAAMDAVARAARSRAAGEDADEDADEFAGREAETGSAPETASRRG